MIKYKPIIPTACSFLAFFKVRNGGGGLLQKANAHAHVIICPTGGKIELDPNNGVESSYMILETVPNRLSPIVVWV